MKYARHACADRGVSVFWSGRVRGVSDPKLPLIRPGSACSRGKGGEALTDHRLFDWLTEWLFTWAPIKFNSISQPISGRYKLWIAATFDVLPNEQRYQNNRCGVAISKIWPSAYYLTPLDSRLAGLIFSYRRIVNGRLNAVQMGAP